MASSKVVRVKAGNPGSLAEQGLAREQQESVLWHMQVMMKAPYKSAELAVRADGSLAKRPEIVWEPVRNNWERNRKSYYEHKLAGHFEGLRGQWAVCNSNGVAEVYVTSGAARANKQGAAVVGNEALDTSSGTNIDAFVQMTKHLL
ncbi:MAG: hypothetical protein FRX49_07697 [Trebouxia sp. A1-2]|nr:MAG: hypothetical protein FRX49_07697 [Trebouxia sp. A1-2]